MKRVTIALLFALVLCISGCSAPTDEVLESLGAYQSHVYYTSGGFQDYTDYAKYVYDSVDFHDNPYFEKLTTESRTDLQKHLDDFESWIAVYRSGEPDNEVALGYDFDSSCISEEDYLYIDDDSFYPELGCYDVYYFDTEAMTLYYFHNNI